MQRAEALVARALLGPAAEPPRVLRRDRVALGVLVRRDQHQRDGRVDQVLGVEVVRVRRRQHDAVSRPQRVRAACAPADARCPSASRTGSGRRRRGSRLGRGQGGRRRRARRRRARREVSSRPLGSAARERARTHRSRRATHPRSWSVSLPSVPVTRPARIPTCLAPRPRTDEVAHSSARASRCLCLDCRARASVLLGGTRRVRLSRRVFPGGGGTSSGRSSPKRQGRPSPAVIKRHLESEFFQIHPGSAIRST